MNKLFATSFLFLIGCHPLVVYSHHNNIDCLTIESRGDNVSDFTTLKHRGESMCVQNGHSRHISVVSAYPSVNVREGVFPSYTIVYQCQKEGEK